MTPPREIFILAGPNGAGKSTGAAFVLPHRFQVGEFVNADVIQRELGLGTSPVTAGRAMIKRMRRLRGAGATFAFETTLAARTHASFLREAQRVGYIVHLAFISLRSPELAKARVALRVRRGGHDIPAVDIERRYWRGLRNFFDIYQSLANTWTLCDNSSKGIVVIAHSHSSGVAMIHDETRYEELKRAVKQ